MRLLIFILMLLSFSAFANQRLIGDVVGVERTFVMNEASCGYGNINSTGTCTVDFYIKEPSIVVHSRNTPVDLGEYFVWVKTRETGFQILCEKRPNDEISINCSTYDYLEVMRRLLRKRPDLRLLKVVLFKVY